MSSPEARVSWELEIIYSPIVSVASLLNAYNIRQKAPKRKFTEKERARLKRAYSKIIGNEDCQKFLEKLVELAEKIAPGVRRHDDFRSLFQSVEFYMFGEKSYNTARGSVELGTAQVIFSGGIGRNFPKGLKISREYFKKLERLNERNFWRFAPMTALHELVHTTGIPDSIAAQAVALIKKEDISHITSMEEGFDKEWAASGYWDAELQNQCNPDVKK